MRKMPQVHSHHAKHGTMPQIRLPNIRGARQAYTRMHRLRAAPCNAQRHVDADQTQTTRCTAVLNTLGGFRLRGRNFELIKIPSATTTLQLLLVDEAGEVVSVHVDADKRFVVWKYGAPNARVRKEADRLILEVCRGD